jgi:hypothetical protein
VRLWRKRLARLVVGLPDQLRRPARNKPKTPPDSKTHYVTAFFDSIGQTEKNSVRAYVFRFALNIGHCSMHSALRIWGQQQTRASPQG